MTLFEQKTAFVLMGESYALMEKYLYRIINKASSSRYPQDINAVKVKKHLGSQLTEFNRLKLYYLSNIRNLAKKCNFGCHNATSSTVSSSAQA